MRKIRNPATEQPLPGFEVFHDEFLASRKEELQTLKAALADWDFKVLQQIAHQWKGFARPYGFQELEELSTKLDKASEAKNEALCRELLKEIADYLGD